MKNTGIIYSSTERTPVVLPEMAELLPPLSGEQLGALETDLLKNGCYTSIIVNEDLVVIDGHNRKSLCDKHGLPYQMLVFAFDDLLEAKQWALDTQKGRRNLDKWELGKIALKLKPEIEARAKANMSAGGRAYRPSEEGSATLPNLPPVDTRKELADSVGLGERTMGKVMQIDEHAPAAVKEALDKKELSINQGYQITKQVEDLPEEQREQAAQEALDILRAKKEIQEKDAEIDREGKIAGIFCKAYEKAVLLDPTEENVRIWAKCTRMTRDEMENTVKESRELAEVFRTIAPHGAPPAGEGDAMTEMSVRQWQERFRAGDFSSKDRAAQCEAGWYDWFCQDDALAGRLQKLSKVVMGITDPYILDNYYVWFKNNCPLSGPLYDDVRFEPLHGDRNGRYFVVIRDSPHETHKWTIYTERHGFEQPEFTCANVRDMLRHINSMAPETWRGDPQPAKAPRSPQKKRKEAER